MRNITAVKQCLLGEKQAVAELKDWWFATLQIHLFKNTLHNSSTDAFSCGVCSCYLLCGLIPPDVIWALFVMIRGAALPSPLVRNTKQRVRSNPARCTCRPKNTRHQAQNTDSQKRKFSRKSNKTQIQEAEACALGLTDDFLQRCKRRMWTQKLASFFNATKIPITDYIQTSWTLKFGAYYKKRL